MGLRAKSRTRTLHRCQSCGHTETKWMGRCPGCNEWSSFVEEVERTEARGVPGQIQSNEPIPIGAAREVETVRLATQLDEVDRVLGGGLAGGSVVLLGGDPGVGKSTLLLHLLNGLSDSQDPVLYVSGEESVNQTAMRARRLGVQTDNVLLMSETRLENVIDQITKRDLRCLAIDSIQTMQSSELTAIPGSVSQVRECAAKLVDVAKRRDLPLILIGHVTKDGSLAGPKTLEHLVDVVLQFEGEKASPFRILRCNKNRFGSTLEIGVFEMVSDGLKEVSNPSEIFLSERPLESPGSVVVATAEGSRPILVEVQALVAPSGAAMPRRTTAGVESNRLSLLLAVLSRRAGLDLLSSDVFINIAGGVRVTEPAVDLGVAAAVASSAVGKAIPPRTLVFGEVGLSGEVRTVGLLEQRLHEAEKLGFERCICSKKNAQQSGPTDLELIGVNTVHEALQQLGCLR